MVMTDRTMPLFGRGEFQLHSGGSTEWKIDCDALSDEDIETLAWLIARDRTFGSVEGVPTGGLRLAGALAQYARPDTLRVLIVDDVLTTGRSMEEARRGRLNVTGAVIFSRMRDVPSWIHPVFQLK